MYSLILKESVLKKEVAEVLQQFFTVSENEVTYIDYTKSQDNRILFEYNPLKGNYQVEVLIYTVKSVNSMDLATSFAKTLKQNVLTSCASHNPYIWTRISPDGTFCEVQQKINFLDEDFFQIREE
ncbi:hypothetical protein QNI16_19965 [Cytophagaceae bacterium YF14B1]|uniref:Uncharacterized protein n=1 Tax=Xanthocytophaga flava TaxID=3048013 RepID=A0AAE3QNV4_9BACT|nr:hypothetical protein [Xanthocytophaga flavus]MDJ1482787.1 hypothetical protein [Xanthocytophaga flavus]